MYSSEKTSNFVESVDLTFIIIFGISLFFLILITLVMIFFVIRYNKKRHPVPSKVKGSNLLEIIWTIVPTILVLIMFYYGWKSWFEMRKIPDNTFNIKAVARMWSFGFEYENGLVTDSLIIPKGKPVKLELVSQDVIHSLFIPAFRVKQDMVPGMANNYMWFIGEKEGSFDLFCAEYCGLRHSYMITKVVVKSEDDFNKWYNTSLKAISEDASPVQLGLNVLKAQGCFACHSNDGSKLVGSSFKGLFMSERTVVVDDVEKTVTADKDYISRSIFEPNVELVKGYPAVMQDYKGKVKESDVDLIVAYLKSLNE